MTSPSRLRRATDKHLSPLIRSRLIGGVAAGGLLFGSLIAAPSAGASGPTLTRYPYLTDSTQHSVTVNWATSAVAGSSGTVQYGPAGGSCANQSVAGSSTHITVGTVDEQQWKAVLPISPDTRYCYRVLVNGTDLLGADPSPAFTSQVAAGSAEPFSFAVLGDWGNLNGGSSNPDQANVLSQLAQSGARFVVMTGDTAYPNGDQANYGDLQQTGSDMSAVFGPQFWAAPGRSIPAFYTPGDHGYSTADGPVQITNWPEQNVVASSSGRYQMDDYPSINGSAPASYPSMWYAFDAGNARFYVLTAAWNDANHGSVSKYKEDADAHLSPGAAEYEWLKNDLAAHPGGLKFAFWHFPLYSDSAGPRSDRPLQGAPGSGRLQGLLDANHVQIAFNGHAHGYERNYPDAGGMVSYVVGNGGGKLAPLQSTCSAFDAYAISTRSTHCGSATGVPDSEVYGFVKVSVDGDTVTVTPTSSTGRTYDVQTYQFSTGGDTSAPSAPANLVSGSPSDTSVSLSWDASSDNVGVTGYRVYRDGTMVGSPTGTSYTDTGLTPATSYSYTVKAVDAAGNLSGPSNTVTVTTTTTTDSSSGGTVSFAAAGDAWVDQANPNTNHGGSNRLSVDGSPVHDTLVKFDITGTGAGTSCASITRAELAMTVGGNVNDHASSGGDVYGTDSTAWTESTVTWNNAPAADATPTGSFPDPVEDNTTYTADITPLVTGNGDVTVRIHTSAADAAWYLSTEGATPTTAPTLTLTCGS
jgi:hypothetical protein